MGDKPNDTPNNVATITLPDGTELGTGPMEEVVANAQRTPRNPDLISLDKIMNLALLRSCKFALHLTKHPACLVPFTNNENLNINLTDFTFLCDSIEMPGRSLTTTEVMIPGRYKIKTPYRREFNEITMSFYHSNFLPMHYYFTSWADSASPSTGTNEFFDNIITKLLLIQFDDTHNKYEIIELHGAYPLSVASLPCNWADDGFHKIQVTFFYEFIRTENRSFELAAKAQNAAKVMTNFGTKSIVNLTD